MYNRYITIAVITTICVIFFLVGVNSRRCDSDCECKMGRGQRCAYRAGRGVFKHCSLNPKTYNSGCFCKKGCLMSTGEIVKKRSVFYDGCNNCICTNPRKNLMACTERACL